MLAHKVIWAPAKLAAKNRCYRRMRAGCKMFVGRWWPHGPAPARETTITGFGLCSLPSPSALFARRCLGLGPRSPVPVSAPPAAFPLAPSSLAAAPRLELHPRRLSPRPFPRPGAITVTRLSLTCASACDRLALSSPCHKSAQGGLARIEPFHGRHQCTG